MSAENDRFALHVAAREGRGKSSFVFRDSQHLALIESITNDVISGGCRGNIKGALVLVCPIRVQISSTHDTNTGCQSDSKSSKRKDDDGRYPIHWASSANNLDIVVLLASQPDFDPDVQVEHPLPISHLLCLQNVC